MTDTPLTMEGDVRLVYVATDGITWTLDGIVHSTGSALGRPGTPVTVELERPGTRWFDVAMHEMLSRWVNEGRVVTLRLAIAVPHPHAQVQMQGTLLRVHLVGIA